MHHYLDLLQCRLVYLCMLNHRVNASFIMLVPKFLQTVLPAVWVRSMAAIMRCPCGCLRASQTLTSITAPHTSVALSHFRSYLKPTMECLLVPLPYPGLHDWCAPTLPATTPRQLPRTSATASHDPAHQAPRLSCTAKRARYHLSGRALGRKLDPECKATAQILHARQCADGDLAFGSPPGGI